ncbi:MAG: hypothetical protein HUJ80_04535, partial [Firmicutes bacterium]|nr:hypothetical protein [Bacillota bacterium]
MKHICTRLSGDRLEQLTHLYIGSMILLLPLVFGAEGYTNLVSVKKIVFWGLTASFDALYAVCLIYRYCRKKHAASEQGAPQGGLCAPGYEPSFSCANAPGSDPSGSSCASNTGPGPSAGCSNPLQSAAAKSSVGCCNDCTTPLPSVGAESSAGCCNDCTTPLQSAAAKPSAGCCNDCTAPLPSAADGPTAALSPRTPLPQRGHGPKNFALYAFIAYLLWTLLSAVCSPYGLVAFTGRFRGMGAFAILAAGIAAIFVSRSFRASRRCLYLTSFALLVQDAIALLQLFGLNPLGLYPQGYTFRDAGIRYSGSYLGTVGNADLFAAALVLGAGIM